MTVISPKTRKKQARRTPKNEITKTPHRYGISRANLVLAAVFSLCLGLYAFNAIVFSSKQYSVDYSRSQYRQLATSVSASEIGVTHGGRTLTDAAAFAQRTNMLDASKEIQDVMYAQDNGVAYDSSETHNTRN